MAIAAVLEDYQTFLTGVAVCFATEGFAIDDVFVADDPVGFSNNRNDVVIPAADDFVFASFLAQPLLS